jgi:hypothetical protein
MYHGLHVKYPLNMPHFNTPQIFATDFLEILMSNFTKICWYVNDVTKTFPVGAICPMRACGKRGGRPDGRTDRQTDMTKVPVTSSQYREQA